MYYRLFQENWWFCHLSLLFFSGWAGTFALFFSLSSFNLFTKSNLGSFKKEIPPHNKNSSLNFGSAIGRTISSQHSWSLGSVSVSVLSLSPSITSSSIHLRSCGRSRIAGFGGSCVGSGSGGVGVVDANCVPSHGACIRLTPSFAILMWRNSEQTFPCCRPLHGRRVCVCVCGQPLSCYLKASCRI